MPSDGVDVEEGCIDIEVDHVEAVRLKQSEDGFPKESATQISFEVQGESSRKALRIHAERRPVLVEQCDDRVTEDEGDETAHSLRPVLDVNS